MSEYNCSICKECDSFSRFQSKYLSEEILVKLCEFIIISCFVLALHLLDVVISSEYKLKQLKLSQIKLNSKRIVHAISLSLLILTLPFLTMLIAGAVLYKVLCSVAIKRKDKRFVKFLDSIDVFYCLEERTTIDIQGTIQSNTIELAVDKIKEKLRNVFTNYGADKIFYRRNEDYGFYYWRRYSNIDLGHYVQVEDVPKMIEEKSYIKVENATVSNNDEGLFKVLIKKNHEDKTEDEYKITLKFHHSVEDTALTKFLTRLVEESDDFYVTLDSIPKEQDRESPDAIIDMITRLYAMLAQSLAENNLSGNNHITINRMKELKWTESDENLLSKVNDVCDLNFSDLVGGALGKVLDTLDR